MAKIRKWDNKTVSEYVEILEPYILPVGKQNGIANVNNSMAVLETSKWEINAYNNNKKLYMDIYHCIICNSQNLLTTQMSINTTTDSQNVVYSYNCTWLTYKKEWSTDTLTCINHKPWKQYVKWKKLITEWHTLRFYLYKSPEEGNL